MAAIKENLAGKNIWASVDETMDSQGRYVANLIVGIMENTPGNSSD
jgi:hypothetical protein